MKNTAQNRFNFIALLAVVLAMFAPMAAHAASNTGTELQAAFTSLNGMVGGYGKQIMVLVGFFLGAIGIMLAQAASALMKFVGYAIFLGTGLTAAMTVSGAVI
jgi:hypothetical protein